MTPTSLRRRLRLLDACLLLLEESLEKGQSRVDARLGSGLRELLGQAGLVPDHRLEGRRVDKVLDDIFDLQEELREDPAGQAS